MMSGRISRMRSKPSPQRSMTPYAKFSITTSLSASSRSRYSKPFGCRTFSVTLRFPACFSLNQWLLLRVRSMSSSPMLVWRSLW